MRTYDPEDVNTIVGGTLIEGFAEGSFITAGMTSQLVTFHKGRGPRDGGRVIDRNLHGNVVFQVLQTSPSNEYLQGFLNQIRNRDPDAFSLLIINSSGGEEVRADAAWTVGEPQLVMTKGGLEARQWTIESDNMRIFTRSDYSEIRNSFSSAQANLNS